MLTEMELARHNLHAKAHIMNNVQNEIKEGEVSEGDSDSDVDSSDKDDISLSNTYVTNELTMITSRRERKATKRLSLWEKTKIKKNTQGSPLYN
jgi:Ser-tRNA(Ala) deacylase AlaX